jgi:hypothetical protein
MKVREVRLYAIRKAAFGEVLVLGCIVILSAGLFVAPRAQAWSSKSYPLFEPVHQMAIDNVLKKTINSHDLKVLEDEQDAVDADQAASDSFKHSMTGLDKGQSEFIERPLYIQRSEEFVQENLAQAIQGRRSGSGDQALRHLGAAIHALEDATSPVHEPFQTWSYKEGKWAAATHVFKERIYPDDSAPNFYRSRLEGAVHYAYDIYVEIAPAPARFYDPLSGQLLLPPPYDLRVSNSP